MRAFVFLLVAILLVACRSSVFLAPGPTCPDSTRFLYMDLLTDSKGAITHRAWCEKDVGR